MFSLAPAGLARAPYLRLSPDLATHWRPRAPPSRGRAAPSLLAWGGDLPFSGRALDSDGFPDDGEFSVDEEPGTPPATPDAKLAEGQVVLLEVRDGNGAVTRFSHAYPVDPEGKVRIPTVGPVAARDLTLVELREVLGRAFAGIVSGGSVNLTPSSDTVFYAEPIARSTQLYLRILDSQGAVDPSSGAYAVDSQARLHLPRLGDIDTANYTLGQLETSLQRAIDDRVRGTVVNLSKTALP
jgi:protein involved in polysaccharide export with SLBB domain